MPKHNYFPEEFDDIKTVKIENKEEGETQENLENNSSEKSLAALSNDKPRQARRGRPKGTSKLHLDNDKKNVYHIDISSEAKALLMLYKTYLSLKGRICSYDEIIKETLLSKISSECPDMLNNLNLNQ